MTRLGYRLVVGERRTTNRVRAESPWVSLRGQRGNADDALLRRLWGPQRHALLAAPRGRRRRHAGTVPLALAGLGLAARGRRRAATVTALGGRAASPGVTAPRLRAPPGARLSP